MSRPTGFPTVWIFLRHGESVANRDGWLSGWEDVEMTARGLDQARLAGEALAAIPFRRVLTSDLARARVTTELALETWTAVTAQPLPVVESVPSLRERRLGDWQGQKLADLRADGRSSTLVDWFGRPPGGGESLSDLASRALTALAARDSDEPTLVVAHGGVIRSVLGLLDALPRDEAARSRIPNARPLVRQVPPGTWAWLAQEEWRLRSR